MRISDWSSDVCSSDLRRRRPERREILPDPRFGDVVLSKFMNSVMLDGKKSVAEGIVYGALESVEARAKKEPIGVFHEALANIRPNIEVRSRRVGGATYQVPVEVRPDRAQRSEEHTSELQSLMRISYAVFCLKK